MQSYYYIARAVISLFHTCSDIIMSHVQSYHYFTRAVISLFHTCSHITISHVQSYHCFTRAVILLCRTCMQSSHYFTRAVIFLYRDVISLTFLVTLTLIRITEHVTPGLTRHLVTSRPLTGIMSKVISTQQSSMHQL